MRVFTDWQAFWCDTKRGKLSAFRIDHPGSSLNEQQQEEVLDFLAPVAAAAFGRSLSIALRDDVRRHVFTPTGLIVVTDTIDRVLVPVAFRMWDFIPHKLVDTILYLAGMCVLPEYQGLGIGASLMRYVIDVDKRNTITSVDQFCPRDLSRYVALRTQNPRIKKMFDQAARTTSFPNNEEVPQYIQGVAVTIAKYLGDTHLDATKLVSKGAFGESLYGALPHTQDGQIENLFNGIDRQHGDAIYCIWDRNAQPR